MISLNNAEARDTTVIFLQQKFNTTNSLFNNQQFLKLKMTAFSDGHTLGLPALLAKVA